MKNYRNTTAGELNVGDRLRVGGGQHVRFDTVEDIIDGAVSRWITLRSDGGGAYRIRPRRSTQVKVAV